MNTSLSATRTDAIGVLVLEEFACFEVESFLDFIGRAKEYIPHQYLRWRDSSTRPERGFNSRYGRCDIVTRGKSVDVHLFNLPVSIPRDFNLSDLIFPVEIRGCLLFANRQASRMSENGTTTWPKKRFPGWLNWIQAQKTTFLVAVTGSDSPALPVDRFCGYLGLGPETQVLELHSHVTTDQYDHVFETTEAKHVLTTLVENIITDMEQASD